MPLLASPSEHGVPFRRGLGNPVEVRGRAAHQRLAHVAARASTSRLADVGKPHSEDHAKAREGKARIRETLVFPETANRRCRTRLSTGAGEMSFARRLSGARRSTWCAEECVVNGTFTSVSGSGMCGVPLDGGLGRGHARGMKQTRWVALLSLVSITGFSACGESNPSSSTGDTADAADESDAESDDESPMTDDDEGPMTDDDDVPDPDVLPLLCASCSSDGELEADPGGEPPDCSGTARSIDVEETEDLGYDLSGLSALVEGSFSAPVRWRGKGDETTLWANIEMTTTRLLEREPVAATDCADHLLVGLVVELETEDGALSGTLEADMTIEEPGEIPAPVWVSLRGWQNDLRGDLQLGTGDLGDPQALELWFNLMIPAAGDPRMGVEVLGLYGRDLDAGDFGYTTTLEEARPTDDCPAYTLPEGDECASVRAP